MALTGHFVFQIVLAYGSRLFDHFYMIQHLFRQNTARLIFISFILLSTGATAGELYIPVGASSHKKAGDAGGTQPHYGVGYLGGDDWLWQVQLRGDNLGKDAVGMKKDRLSWMFGVGKTFGPLSFMVSAGIIDTLTVTSFDPDQTVVDPWTGTTLSYDDSGMKHAVLPGYQVSLLWDFYEGQSFNMSADLSYSNTLSTTDYGGYAALGLRFGFGI